MAPKSVMPQHFKLGQHHHSALINAIGFYKDKVNLSNPEGLRTIMGFKVPKWQRPLVWTMRQKISLIESIWSGLNIGTYSYNVTPTPEHPLDLVLIDGQQRLFAIQEYIEDKFKVHGYLYSEITVFDRRRFGMSHFSCYETHTEDEQYLKDYYNLTNFGGTAHKEEERA